MRNGVHDVVAISGGAGAGTTTAAKLVAARTGMTYVNTGAIFREMAQERGMTLNDFGVLVAQNPDVDRELDRRQVARARQGSVVLEGRLAGYMLSLNKVESLKVFITAPEDVRVQRIAHREGISEEQARALTVDRESVERKRYLDTYGFDLLDTSVYDLTLDSSLMPPDEIAAAIINRLKP